MNRLLLIILFSSHILSSCHTNKNKYDETFNDEVKKLYLGLNLNQNPSKVIESEELNFEIKKLNTGSERKGHLKKLISCVTHFNNHPNINSDIKSGSISIEYYEPKHKEQKFEWDLIMIFNDKIEMLIEYEELVHRFEKYSLKTKIYEREKDESGVFYSSTEFHLSIQEESPRLSFTYNKLSDKGYLIIITYNPKLDLVLE